MAHIWEIVDTSQDFELVVSERYLLSRSLSWSIVSMACVLGSDDAFVRGVVNFVGVERAIWADALLLRREFCCGDEVLGVGDEVGVIEMVCDERDRIGMDSRWLVMPYCLVFTNGEWPVVLLIVVGIC